MPAPNGSSEKEEKEKDGVNTAHWIKHGKENRLFLLDMLEGKQTGADICKR
jgi:hypothetical protein